MDKLLDIIGFIKINPNDELRVKFLKATMDSYSFLGERANRILAIDHSDFRFHFELSKEFPDWKILQPSGYSSYGQYYSSLFIFSKTNFILNFLEDHFMLCNDIYKIAGILHDMNIWNINVLKASFHKIDINSVNGISIYNFMNVRKVNSGYIYLNDQQNFNLYQKHYGSRYYLGVNALMTKKFAIKFWERNIPSTRPHEYEIANFDSNFLHHAMVPGFEIQCPIDDDHGETGSCLWSRKEPKFLEAREKWKF
ncbi:MAG: hypothetical protein PHX80_04520 [Candidatus Nanoarchaeia archaeon]|nr:hypothetical protein [Candidatus Nanoarchaeia archaeon]